MKTSTSSLPDRLLRTLLPAAFWLAVWWGAALLVDQQLLIPTPLSVLRELGELAVTAPFWRSTALSLLRIFLGAAIGVALGTLAAAATHWVPAADWVLSPAIRVVRATPVASFIILVLLWVSTGRVPCVITALMVLPVLWENVSAGLRSADPQLLELGQAYQFSRWKRLRYLYLPAERPLFSAGVCNAVGLAWKSGVAAEVLCLPKAAIGTQVYYSRIYLQTPSLFAWTIVVILLSLLLERLVRRALGVKGGTGA